MAALLERDRLPYVIGGGVLVVTSLVVLHRWKRTKPQKVFPRDKVIIHQVGRGPAAPSMSPFPLKLETYCRMASVPHEANHAWKFSKKNKTPFITYNDDEVADSQFCIEYINQKFHKDLNSHLTEEQKAIGRAFQKMTEENLYWVIVCHRWLFSPKEHMQKMFGKSLTNFRHHLIVRKIRQQTYSVGMSRHTEDEVFHIGNLDLKALNDFIGSKKYLLGDKVSEFDAAIFGMLAQIQWQQPPGKLTSYYFESCKNLIVYCKRIADEFWPDWDDYNTHHNTVIVTK